MDHLSISEQSDSLATSCIQLSTSITKILTDGVPDEDKVLHDLALELLGFSETLQSIDAIRKQRAYVVVNGGHDAICWTNVKDNVECSRVTVQRLAEAFEAVDKSGDSKSKRFFKAIALAARLGFQVGKINAYRTRLRSHRGAMEACLEMMRICAHLQNNVAQDVWPEFLARFRSKMILIEAGIRNTKNGSYVSNDETIERKTMMAALENLQAAANTFYAEMSTRRPSDASGNLTDPALPSSYSGEQKPSPQTEGYNSNSASLQMRHGIEINTALNSAARAGHADVVKLLLEKGADSSSLDDLGQTPLYAASIHGHVEIVKLLLDAGADPSIPSQEHKWTPLNAAVSNNHLEVMQVLLVRGANPSIANDEGYTPLHVACLAGNVDMVRTLLKYGANVSTPTITGYTPLYSASMKDSVEIAELLLEMGADPNVVSENGWTPLNSACWRGYTGMAKLLLSCGADLTIVSNSGHSPLHSASSEGHADIVALLLEREAQIKSNG